MFSIFKNKNKQVLEAIENYCSDKTYRFPYRLEEIDKAKAWYMSNNAQPDLILVLQMIAVKRSVGQYI